MRKSILAILLFGLSATASHAFAGSGRSQSPPKRSKEPLIGYIRNEDLVDMCGCAFEHLTRTRGYTFASDAEGREAWMNIDGEDVKLKLTSATRAKAERIGSRYTEEYEANGIHVRIVRIVNRLCIPYSPDCETTGYDVIITVRKRGRTETVKAKGQCGCV